LTNGQHHIDAKSIVDAEFYACALRLFEARLFHGNDVRTDGKLRDRILAAIIRHLASSKTGGSLLDRHMGAFDDGP
jgi:hypothetical protein